MQPIYSSCLLAMASGSLPQSPLYQRPELRTLCAIVRTAKWYQLGIQLKVDRATLEDIGADKDGPEEKRQRMFDRWLRTNPEATNKQLLDALQMKVIGEVTMAKEYEAAISPEGTVNIIIDTL